MARVLELVGPPAAGKTTIVRELLSRGPEEFEELTLRGWRSAWLVARSTSIVSIPFLSQCSRMKSRRWNRLSLMVRLQTLAGLVDSAAAGSGVVLVLDQGPVYMLSILQRALNGGGAARNSRAFETFWGRTVNDWSRRLDLVVELEASDAVLYRRVIERDKHHPAARLDQDRAYEFFNRSRASRRRILSQLQAPDRGPMLLSLRTDKLFPDEAARCIRSRLDAVHG